MKIYRVIETCPLFSKDYSIIKEPIFVSREEVEKYCNDLEIIDGVKDTCNEYRIIEIEINREKFNIIMDKVIFDYEFEKENVLTYNEEKWLNGEYID